jgi:hypothetical protein
MVDQIPPELIVLEPDKYAEYVSSIEAIRTAINTWPTRGAGYVLERGPGLRKLHPVDLLRDSLAACPDESPTPSTADLTFITDAPLRESIRLDISVSNQALSNGEWKAATVLAGATVEALLLWALQQLSSTNIQTGIKNLLSSQILKKNPGKNLEKWNLHELIEVAKSLNVIKDSTAEQAKLAKDFRNLIHPGRSFRLKQICDRGTALSAVAAVEHVIRDLTP